MLGRAAHPLIRRPGHVKPFQGPQFGSKIPHIKYRFPQSLQVRRRSRAEGITAAFAAITRIDDDGVVFIAGGIRTKIDAGSAVWAKTGIEDPFDEFFLPHDPFFYGPSHEPLMRFFAENFYSP